jgi:hypothetical protein
LLKPRKQFLIKDEERDELSKEHTSWKIVLERLIGNVVISEINNVKHFVLSKEEKHVS